MRPRLIDCREGSSRPRQDSVSLIESQNGREVSEDGPGVSSSGVFATGGTEALGATGGDASRMGGSVT
jgi:hypothetical protein